MSRILFVVVALGVALGAGGCGREEPSPRSALSPEIPDPKRIAFNEERRILKLYDLNSKQLAWNVYCNDIDRIFPVENNEVQIPMEASFDEVEIYSLVIGGPKSVSVKLSEVIKAHKNP